MKGKTSLCLLLIAAMLITSVRPSSAASYTAATWLSPRSADWANDGKTFSSTQNYGAQPYKEIFTYREGGSLKNVVYCLSPQSRRTAATHYPIFPTATSPIPGGIPFYPSTGTSPGPAGRSRSCSAISSISATAARSRIIRRSRPKTWLTRLSCRPLTRRSRPRS